MIIHHPGIYETQRICIQKTKQYLEKQTISKSNKPTSIQENQQNRKKHKQRKITTG